MWFLIYIHPTIWEAYELGCRDIVEGLSARGHTLMVLTSTYKLETDTQDEVLPSRTALSSHHAEAVKNDHEADALNVRVRRQLKLAYFDRDVRGFIGRLAALLRREKHNQQVFLQTCADFKPDLIYFWNMSGLSISLAFLAQQQCLPISFFASEHWLSHWENDEWYANLFPSAERLGRKRIVPLLRLTARLQGIYAPSSAATFDLRYVHFCSQYLKQAALEAGQPVENGAVIHWGVDTDLFSPARESYCMTRLLYTGRLEPEKGVHTVLEAMHLLKATGSQENVTLTIVGGAANSAYETRLQNMTREFGIQDKVRFTGALSREQLPSIYRNHDIYIFPSVWGEPFAIAPLEAMSCGLAVVATMTGGSAEIFVPDENSLTFCAEDAQDCASQLVRLLKDAQLFETIRQNGNASVVEKHTVSLMLDKSNTIC